MMKISKILLICVVLLVLLSSLSFAMPVSDVKLTGYLNDYTGTIKSDDADTINELASSLKNAGAAEVAVVIVDSLNGLTKEEYAITIAHEHLGDTDKDNGLLILVAMQEREYRIEVGYGLEGVLNDAKVGKIARDTLVPNFRENDYGWGIIQFIATVHLELLPDQEETIPANYVDTGKEDENMVFSIIFGIFAVIFFIFANIFPLIIVLIIIRGLVAISIKNKGKGKKRNDDDSLTAAVIASSFFGRGGGGSGGFSGGGFSGGGFGGGGFGGGGAGGSW